MKKDENDELEEFVEELQEQIRAEERMVYSKKAIEEYEKPKNLGMLKNADGEATIQGPCGDTMEIYLKIKEEKINQVSYMTYGCGVSVACGSMVTSIVKGMPLHSQEM